MAVFFEPQNVNQWNILNEVKHVEHIEPFLATKDMKIGDYLLLYIGQQNKQYKPGVYAIGRIISNPYILRNRPTDYCNNKLSVDVEIVRIDHHNPIINYYQMKQMNKQYRRVHRLHVDGTKLKIILSENSLKS